MVVVAAEHCPGNAAVPPSDELPELAPRLYMSCPRIDPKLPANQQFALNWQVAAMDPKNPSAQVPVKVWVEMPAVTPAFGPQ